VGFDGSHDKQADIPHDMQLLLLVGLK
jgi:hypothetical protein